MKAIIVLCFLVFVKNLSLFANETPSSIDDLIERESTLIEQNLNLNSAQLAALYLDRAESYFVSGYFQSAIEDFQKGYDLDFCCSTQCLDNKIRSLFGMMLSYAKLGDDAMVDSISQYLQNAMTEMGCDYNLLYPCKDESYVIGPDKEPYKGWCREAVSSTALVLRTIVKGSPITLVAKKHLMYAIDMMQKEGLRCCSKGGFWKGCVGPLAKKLHEWKTSGIPTPAPKLN